MLVTCYLLGIDTQTPSVAGDASVADEDLLDEESHIIDSRNDRYAIICNVRSVFPALQCVMCVHVQCISTDRHLRNHLQCPECY